MTSQHGKALTFIQKKLLDKLADGKEHYVEELRGCLDELSEPNTIHVHLSGIRRYLEKQGEVALVCHRYGIGNTTYNLVPLSAII